MAHGGHPAATIAHPAPDAVEPHATARRGVRAGTPARGGDARLADLPVAGLTRRRIGLLVAAVVAAWVLVLFARQAGEAAAAGDRAERMRGANAALAAEIDALEDELALIQRQAYVAQQARAHRLGAAREVPFVLEDDAPPLGPDAPGAAGLAARRLGAPDAARTPLEAWLDLLLGPGDPAAGAR